MCSLAMVGFFLSCQDKVKSESELRVKEVKITSRRELDGIAHEIANDLWNDGKSVWICKR